MYILPLWPMIKLIFGPNSILRCLWHIKLNISTHDMVPASETSCKNGYDPISWNPKGKKKIKVANVPCLSKQTWTVHWTKSATQFQGLHLRHSQCHWKPPVGHCCRQVWLSFGRSGNWTPVNVLTPISISGDIVYCYQQYLPKTRIGNRLQALQRRRGVVWPMVALETTMEYHLKEAGNQSRRTAPNDQIWLNVRACRVLCLIWHHVIPVQIPSICMLSIMTQQ